MLTPFNAAWMYKLMYHSTKDVWQKWNLGKIKWEVLTQHGRGGHTNTPGRLWDRHVIGMLNILAYGPHTITQFSWIHVMRWVQTGLESIASPTSLQVWWCTDGVQFRDWVITLLKAGDSHLWAALSSKGLGVGIYRVYVRCQPAFSP